MGSRFYFFISVFILFTTKSHKMFDFYTSFDLKAHIKNNIIILKFYSMFRCSETYDT